MGTALPPPPPPPPSPSSSSSSSTSGGLVGFRQRLVCNKVNSRQARAPRWSRTARTLQVLGPGWCSDQLQKILPGNWEDHPRSPAVVLVLIAGDNWRFGESTSGLHLCPPLRALAGDLRPLWPSRSLTPPPGQPSSVGKHPSPFMAWERVCLQHSSSLILSCVCPSLISTHICL